MRIIISFFTFFLFSITAITAQVNEQFFSDPDSRTGGLIYGHVKYNNTTIIAGRTFDKIKYMPSVMCVDTMGTVLWNTATYDTSSYYTSGEVYQLILDSLGFIYAASRDGGSGLIEFWKIDPATGAILWKKDAQINFNNPHTITDYDSTQFISSHNVNTGTIVNNYLSLISKATGDTTWTKLLFSSTSIGLYNICVDPQKNIYYNKADTMIKLDATNLSNQLFAVSHSGALMAHQKYYYDAATASVIDMGFKTSGSFKKIRINKVDAATGTILTQYTGGVDDVYYKAIQTQGNNLYISWEHIYTGSGTEPYFCTKYNMTTGTVTWDLQYVPVGYGGVVTAGSDNGALGIDLDSSGNIFLTGYYGGGGWGPSNWGIMKLDNNGTKLYEQTITLDTTYNDEYSEGKVVSIINNVPCFFGRLETIRSGFATTTRAKTYFAKLDNTSGNITALNYLEGNYQFPSRTIDIQNYPPNLTLVLKQTGAKCRVEMYDYGKNLLWGTDLSEQGFLFADALSFAPGGDIYVSAHSCPESNISPYYSTTTDSLYLFKLNNTGNIVSFSRFSPSPSSNVYSTELHATDSSILYVYQKTNIVYLRKWDSGVFGVEKNTGLQYNAQYSEEKYIFDKDTNTAFVFGFSSSTAQVHKFVKASSGLTFLAAIPNPIYKINYVLETDTNKVILCSKNNLNKESMALYNTTTLDTVWTKLLSTTIPSEVLKCVTDPSKSYIYSISKNSNNIVVRKLNVSNGAQQWAYTYTGGAGLDDSPVDITYDANKDQVIVAGYESAASGDFQTLSLVLGTDGIPADSIVQASEFTGNSVASCANVLSDGTQWIGGNINKIAGGLAGFIYEVGPTLASPNFVWPGDADKTMLVDNNDLLPIGLFYSSTGPSRSSGSNSWTGFSSMDWGVLEPGGADIKHADCNGDGIINDSDTLAVNQNFSLTHSILGPATEYRSSVPDIYFVTSSLYYYPGDWINAELWLGNSSLPVSDLYGLAFDISYDASMVEPGTETLNYTSSWLGTPGSDVIKLSKINALSNAIYGAEIRTDHINANGYGKIANFKFQANTSISLTDSMILQVSYVNAIDSIGTTKTINTLPLTIMILGNVSVPETQQLNNIKIYPNPFSDHFTVLFEAEQKETNVRITDLLGRELKKFRVSGKELQIERGDIHPGIYMLQIEEKNKPVVTRKIIVN